MVRKQKLKFFFKFFGIGSAIAVGAVGLVSAYLGITGGFDPVIIEPTTIAFDTNNVYYQSNVSSNEPFFVVSDDFVLKVNPDPEDANQLDAKLKIDEGSSLVKSIQVKNPDANLEDEDSLYIDAEKDSVGYYPIKLGEEFKVVLSEEHYLESLRKIQFYVESQATSTFCRASIWVDAKLESFELEKVGNEYLFPTDEFYIKVKDSTVSPSVALERSELSQLTANGKTIEYRVTDGFDIVTILSTTEKDGNGIPMAKVKINEGKSGKFTISAYICDKYENVKNILSEEDYSQLIPEEQEKYNAKTYGGTIFDGEGNEESFDGFMISYSLELESEPLEVDNITATSNIDGCYLFKTYRYTPQDLQIKINPKDIPGSHYTSDALKPYINDLEVRAGRYINSQSGSDLTIGEGSQERYIEYTDRYLEVRKEADGNDGFMWAITVKDYTLNNCLVFVLNDYEVSGDEQSQGYVEPKICVIDIEVLKHDIPDFGIMIDSNATELNSQKITLSFDAMQAEQTDLYDLSNAKLVLTNDQNEPIMALGRVQEFSKSNSDYKTTLFVTKDDEDNYAMSNTVIKIEDGKIIPVGTGRSYLYAILVQTDKDGNIIDSNGAIIEDESLILSQCHVLYNTASIIIDVYQVLKISTENTIELYKSDNGIVLIEDDDELFEIERFGGEIGLVKMYKGTELFLKLNVNDKDAFKYAYDTRTITFSCDSDLVSLGNLVKENVSGDEAYLLPIKVMDTDELQPNASITINYNQSGEAIAINLTVQTRDYILTAIELSSNGEKSNDETVDAVIKLALFENSDEYYWTASSDLNENKELVITSKIDPSQATIAGMIDYKVYAYPDFDIHSSILTADFIANNLTLSSDVVELNGNPQVDEDYNDTLRFIIKKAGKAVVIASYTRDDGITIYSNAFVIETLYPFFDVDEYNFGVNRAEYTAYEQVNDEYYRVLTTTYENQKTDLLEFRTREKEGLEGVEGSKLRLKYKYSNLDEIEFSNLNVGLYDFDIEIIGEDYAVEDFAIVFENGKQYLVTPKVSKKVYLKISISTKFGYQLSQTYNYVLIPDYNIQGDANIAVALSEFENGNKVNLFDYIIENDQILNNGGKLFITNDFVYSNNCDDNTDHITGEGTVVKKVIYLPSGMEIDENDIPAGYEVKSILYVAINDTKGIVSIDYTDQSLYINNTSQITANYNIGYQLYFWLDEEQTNPEIIIEGQISILVD